VRSGIVVDGAGKVLGILTVDVVMEWMRDDRSREVPLDIADAVAGATIVAGADTVARPTPRPDRDRVV